MSESKKDIDVAIKSLWCSLGALVDIGYSDVDILHVFNDRHIPIVLAYIRDQEKG